MDSHVPGSSRQLQLSSRIHDISKFIKYLNSSIDIGSDNELPTKPPAVSGSSYSRVRELNSRLCDISNAVKNLNSCFDSGSDHAQQVNSRLVAVKNAMRKLNVRYVALLSNNQLKLDSRTVPGS